MIGAGTGLAPFMGFLRDRSLAMKKAGASRRGMFGKCHLFFGCRSEGEMLYKDQLLEWESRGVAKLHIAYSREPGIHCPNRYVHDAMEDRGAELFALMTSEPKTHLYICGDVNMAKACSEKCISLLQEHGSMSKINATRFMSNMRVSNRFQLDVWGTREVEIVDIDFSYHGNANTRLIKEASRRTIMREFNEKY